MSIQRKNLEEQGSYSAEADEADSEMGRNSVAEAENTHENNDNIPAPSSNDEKSEVYEDEVDQGDLEDSNREDEQGPDDSEQENNNNQDEEVSNAGETSPDEYENKTASNYGEGVEANVNS